MWYGCEMQTKKDIKQEIVKNWKEWMMKSQSSVENVMKLKKIIMKIDDSSPCQSKSVCLSVLS